MDNYCAYCGRMILGVPFELPRYFKAKNKDELKFCSQECVDNYVNERAVKVD